MKIHLQNIILIIDTMYNNVDFINQRDQLNVIKNNIISIINNIDLELVKKTSDLIYDLNVANFFDTLTDKISNEYYAFQFLLEKSIKEQQKKS